MLVLLVLSGVFLSKHSHEPAGFMACDISQYRAWWDSAANLKGGSHTFLRKMLASDFSPHGGLE